MINRIMYMSEAVMEADEAVGRLDEILGQEPMKNQRYRNVRQMPLYPLTM